MSFGWPTKNHAYELAVGASAVRSGIREAREALKHDNCGSAARILRRAMRKWGRAKSHEDSILIGCRNINKCIPTKLRQDLKTVGWDEAYWDLDDLEREISIECVRTSRARIIP